MFTSTLVVIYRGWKYIVEYDPLCSSHRNAYSRLLAYLKMESTALGETSPFEWAPLKACRVAAQLDDYSCGDYLINYRA